MLHGGVMLVLLLVPWPASASLAKVALLLLTLRECLRSRRRTRRWQGLFVLLSGQRVQWQQAQWQLVSPPWMTRQAVRLSLRDSQGRHKRLWLFADGMDNSEWRLLRQQLLSKKEWRDE
nr:protein YgfX [Erwinia persicina]